MNLAATVTRLIEEARAMPDPLAAAYRLKLRAKRMEETPLSRWPKGVTAPDFIEAVSNLRLEAQRLTHS
jgi:hypothetical protein